MRTEKEIKAFWNDLKPSTRKMIGTYEDCKDAFRRAKMKKQNNIYNNLDKIKYRFIIGYPLGWLLLYVVSYGLKVIDDVTIAPNAGIAMLAFIMLCLSSMYIFIGVIWIWFCVKKLINMRKK